MKKIWRSKGMIIGLAAVCVLAAGICVIVRMKKDGGTFEPGKPPDETVSEWEEPQRPDTEGTEAESNTVWEEPESRAERPDGTEDSSEVVIEFTTEPSRPEEPEPPEPKGEVTDPAAPPTYEAEEEAPPAESLHDEAGEGQKEIQTEAPVEQSSAPQEPEVSEQPESTPQMDGVREDGAVYDPLFGWVIPSPIIQIEGDSDGDPNKMVGHMD